jgi:hypothetical protein
MGQTSRTAAQQQRSVPLGGQAPAVGGLPAASIVIVCTGWREAGAMPAQATHTFAAASQFTGEAHWTGVWLWLLP